MYKNKISNLLSISIPKCLCKWVFINLKLSNGTVLVGSDSNEGTLGEFLSENGNLAFPGQVLGDHQTRPVLMLGIQYNHL